MSQDTGAAPSQASANNKIYILLDELARAEAINRSGLIRLGEIELQSFLQLIVDSLRAACGFGVVMLNAVNTTTLLVKAVSPNTEEVSAGQLHARTDTACDAVVNLNCMLEVEVR